ncbi:MAG: four helix bundle protein [Tildeniella nuda ZEHNDER 1965/U140]|jgi:four helix bundle protein|nr:four helix bundle protein [Tildeniella nuda ZEHNDER 1965/U140]
MERGFVRSHRDLEVYELAFEAAMRIFELSKKFPVEERYSLSDQMRRSSRSVCANLGEAWRKRRYEAAFIAKLSDSEAEATETQVWLEFAVKCGYLTPETGQELFRRYDQILGKLVNLINNSNKWCLSPKK